MAITEGTQPAPTQPTGTTTTTGAFTPEPGALLVALVAANGLSGIATTASVTDSLGGTWTLLKRTNAFNGSAPFLGGTAEVWCRDSPGTSMTVTASGWSANGGDLTVRTLIGALPAAQQTGATAGTGATGVAPTVTLTPTRIGSRVYGAALDYTTNASLVVNANTTSIDQFVDSTNGDTWATFKASADTSSLSSTTYGYTNANAEYNIAAVEILAAPVGSSQPSTAFHPGRGPSRWSRFYQPPRDTTLFSASLTDTGTAADALAVVDVTVGASSPGGFHPGRGPTFARFYQTPRSTDLNFQSIALTDSGTGDDQISVTATVPLTDAATAVDDSLTITAAVPLVDAGSGVDQLTVADVTVGAQAPTPLHPGKGPTFARFYQTPRSTDVVTATPISLTDTGSGSDALTVSATVPLSDTATGDDQIAVTATISLSDTAAGADALTVVAALGLSEAAAALDALNIQDLTVYPASAVGGARHPGRGPTNARFYQIPRSTDLVNTVVSTPGTITAGSRSATLGPATAGGLLTNTTSGGQA